MGFKGSVVRIHSSRPYLRLSQVDIARTKDVLSSAIKKLSGNGGRFHLESWINEIIHKICQSGSMDGVARVLQLYQVADKVIA